MNKSPRDTTLKQSVSPDKGSIGFPFGTRSIPSLNPADNPQIHPRARYSISYVPRMSEHHIETGRTLMQSQFKVILLACEVERLSTLNYKLVKENEILMLQVDKTEREKDLETKLAIVLAENEKLNQIIEEIS